MGGGRSKPVKSFACRADGFASPGLPRRIFVNSSFRRDSLPARCAGLLPPYRTCWSALPHLFFMRNIKTIADHLALAFIAGPWEFGALVERGERLLGRQWLWLRALALRLIKAFGDGKRPRKVRVYAFLLQDEGFQNAVKHYLSDYSFDFRRLAQVSEPVASSDKWPGPSIDSPAELAALLGLTSSELDWFADRRNLECKVPDGPLRHYRYSWRYNRASKNRASPRLIEAPKTRLKKFQRIILKSVLDFMHCHDAAHGFRQGRSIVSFAAPHVKKDLVLKMDLANFFTSVGSARVCGLFMSLGYPEAVAGLLAGLTVNATPLDVWLSRPVQGKWRERRLYAAPHLPQGAPTSPALANICIYRLDCRLTGLMKSLGGDYTRYADDMAFSGGADFSRAVKRFISEVESIVLEEGFSINRKKTKVMRKGSRQMIAGLVVNQHPDMVRREYDRLKAIVHNCVCRGPKSQNISGHEDFRAHLRGRIEYAAMLNQSRGDRLRELFNRIDWRSANPY